MLVAASSDAGLRRARPAIEAAGMRVAASVLVDDAEARMDLQASASALWIEVDRDCGGSLDSLLARVSREARAGQYAAVVAASAELLDPVLAGLDCSEVALLIDASEVERVSALAVALNHPWRDPRVADVSSDQSVDRLRQLSEEVGRIASTLARLSSSAPISSSERAASVVAVDPEHDTSVSVEQVRNVIRARRLRARYFSEELFADPAWDMLLDLLQAEIAQLRVPVSSLCIAAAVPATTALRWLRSMVDQKLFVRRADPHDGRRVFVELAPEASRALRAYFAELDPVAVV